MQPTLTEILRAPGSGAPLTLEPFSTSARGGAEVIEDGALYDPVTGVAFPVVGGVPVMLPNAFPPAFVEAHRAELTRLPSELSIQAGGPLRWSFSDEWQAHFDTETERTWGWTVAERVEQCLLELDVDRDWCAGKRILDAGCGNGALAQGLAELGAEVVGLDLSDAVHFAEAARRGPNVQYIQGDLLSPPFEKESFDAVISIGVLHHTPDTPVAFRALASLVAPGGRYYVWLYRRPEAFLKRYVKVPLYDTARWFVTRLPPSLQRRVVRTHAGLIRGVHRLSGRSRDIPQSEYLIAAYDDLTPRWRWYHTAYEVAGWFHSAGFSTPRLSHWDNPYGFGMAAVRAPQPRTPGIHFGSAPKLWDESQTVIG